MEAPLLGFSPHYKDSGNLEMQQKTHDAYNSINMGRQHKDKEWFNKNCVEVILQPGDVLYHPAGIWHSVFCNEDSIAINLSMRAMRLGEFVTSAIQGELYKNLNQRQFLRFTSHEDLI